VIRLALRGLLFYWRSTLGVLGGTLLAAAVLTGALLVGDSVDYSLRAFATMRLGDIHFTLDARAQLIVASLADRLAEQAENPVVPVLQLRGICLSQPPPPAEASQINDVSVIGVREDFWDFGQGDRLALGPFETALNRRLAEALGVQEGDEVSLRVAKPALMSRDAPLSWRNAETSRRNRYTVTRIVPDAAMGRFGLTPSQRAPYNAFVDLSFLQEQVELPGRANLLLVGAGGTREEVEKALGAAWELRDIGLEFRRHENGVVQLESDRVFLSDAVARAALEIPGAQGSLTYLATSLATETRRTPYFFIVAGPVPANFPDDAIIINRWMADELVVGEGDRVTLAYAELLPNSDFHEQTRTFRVAGIREMASLEAERDLMPEFPGLSDVESCSDWDVGMPMDETLLNDKANEAYWEEFRDTPKAFVSLAAGQAMWGNRFGGLTAVRYPKGASPDPLADSMRTAIDPAEAGLFLVPVRAQAEASVAQAMNLGGLFLGMSFFLIAAALLLTALLFVFGAQQRASQIGMLGALGFRRGQIWRLFLLEGGLTALLGAGAGALFGTLYTRMLLFGLSRYWGGAVANATILYHAQPSTLFIGAMATLLCALAALALSIRHLLHQSPRVLLTQDFSQHGPRSISPKRPRTGFLVPVTGFLAAVGIVVFSLAGGIENLAAAFFGVGALLLVVGVVFFWQFLVGFRSRTDMASFSLDALAMTNLTRRPGRGLAVVAMLASGCFLVFAVSAMQEDPAAGAAKRSSGTGGFAILAESTLPLREKPSGPSDADGVSVVAIKVRDGDDASCLNLYQAQSPRLLGIDTEDMRSRGAFTASGKDESPWELLDIALSGGEIPGLVGDANTAMWTLKKKTDPASGDVLRYRDASGKELRVRLVGTLPMRLSLFQGSVLISQATFTRHFPSEDGHRMFLIDAPEEAVPEVIASLRKEYDREGLDAVRTEDRLREFHAVEATYLAMFLVLGGLGLAVGSIGMAVVVLRNLFERRPELALLSVLGYRRKHVRRLLLLEYGLLVFAGLGIGGITAAVSLLPSLFAAEGSVAVGAQVIIAIVVLASYGSCLAAALLIGGKTVGPDVLRNE